MLKSKNVENVQKLKMLKSKNVENVQKLKS